MGIRTAILLAALLLVFQITCDADVDVPAVVAKCNPSVVLIRMLDSDEHLLGCGSGFVVAPGLVATCYHVVEDGAQARVKTHDRIEYPVAKVVAASRARDIALLSVPKMTGVPVLELRELSSIQVGEDAIAIGSPQGFEGTVTTGVVSAVREYGDYGTVVQTSAPISQGNSGGPLVDGDCRVLGVVSFFWTRGQNLNFAVPASEVRKLMEAEPDSSETSQAAKLLRPEQEGASGPWGYLAPRAGTWSLRVPNREPYTAALPAYHEYILEKVQVSSCGTKLTPVDEPEDVTPRTYCVSDLGVFWFDSIYAGESIVVSAPYFPRRVAICILRDDTGGDLREMMVERCELVGDEPVLGAEVDTVVAKYVTADITRSALAIGQRLNCAYLIAVALYSEQMEYNQYKNLVTVQVQVSMFDLNTGQQLLQETREDYFIHGKLGGFRHDRRLMAERMLDEML